MFPGNKGVGTATDAEVKSRKKAKKIADAFMFLPRSVYSSSVIPPLLVKHFSSFEQVKQSSGIFSPLETYPK